MCVIASLNKNAVVQGIKVNDKITPALCLLVGNGLWVFFLWPRSVLISELCVPHYTLFSLDKNLI